MGFNRGNLSFKMIVLEMVYFFLKMEEVKLKYGKCKFILFVDLLSYRVIEYLIELLNMIIFNWVKII